MILPYFWPKDRNDQKCLGWIGEKVWVGEKPEPEIWWGLTDFTSSPKTMIGVCHHEGSFHDRITGDYNGGDYIAGPAAREAANLYWADAGNKTQWGAVIFTE